MAKFHSPVAPLPSMPRQATTMLTTPIAVTTPGRPTTEPRLEYPIACTGIGGSRATGEWGRVPVTCGRILPRGTCPHVRNRRLLRQGEPSGSAAGFLFAHIRMRDSAAEPLGSPCRTSLRPCDSCGSSRSRRLSVRRLHVIIPPRPTDGSVDYDSKRFETSHSHGCERRPGGTTAYISRAALLHNAAVIRRAVAASVKVCAIVKANAYGHDAALVVDALCNFSSDDSNTPAVDALAVADLDEAAALPAVAQPVLILRPVENASSAGSGRRSSTRSATAGADRLLAGRGRRRRPHRPGRAAGGRTCR